MLYFMLTYNNIIGGGRVENVAIAKIMETVMVGGGQLAHWSKDSKEENRFI